VPNLDHDGDPGAAGERIVAFARPGKPPEIPFVGRSDLLRHPRGSDKLSRGLNGF
jgi:hypothetical protein